MTEQAGIQLFSKQGVLKAVHHPSQEGNDHVNFQISAKLPSSQTILHKVDRAEWIFRHMKAIDVPLKRQLRCVVSQKENTVRNPILVHEVLRADQPIAQYLEEPQLLQFGRNVQILGKRAQRRLVYLEK